jgi:hypothetical protein
MIQDYLDHFTPGGTIGTLIIVFTLAAWATVYFIGPKGD